MADGAISYYIDHFVQTRVSKLTYGSKSTVIYDPSKAEHRKRPTFRCVSGAQHIDGVFWVLLSGVSYPFVLISEKKNEIINPILNARTSKYPKRMKLVANFTMILENLQIYRLSNRLSIAIEVSLAILPSWIRILVRSIKKSIIVII